MSDEPTCADCGQVIHQTLERAMGGRRDWALVWADESGTWICKTRNEHRPTERNTR